MGLLDRFKSTNIPVSEWTSTQRTIGKLQADHERLELSWQAYRDELRKLVQRWEQRESRARRKEATQEEEADEQPEPTQRQVADEITERIWARRNAKRGSA